MQQQSRRKPRRLRRALGALATTLTIAATLGVGIPPAPARGDGTPTANATSPKPPGCGTATTPQCEQQVATAPHLHVIAQVEQTTFTGDPAHPQLGDREITRVALRDENDTPMGTGASVCTLVRLPPSAILQQCLLTVDLAEGHLMLGGVVPALEVGAVAQLGILGGTAAFRHARGEALLIITPTGEIDTTFDLE